MECGGGRDSSRRDVLRQPELSCRCPLVLINFAAVPVINCTSDGPAWECEHAGVGLTIAALRGEEPQTNVTC